MISGTALDTTGGRNPVQVVVNDTLNKLLKSDLSQRSDDSESPMDTIRIKNRLSFWKDYEKSAKDTTITVRAKANGQFSITAYRTDSLYFQSSWHKPQAYLVADLLKMNTIAIRLEPEVCIPFVPCEERSPSNFYIFVGQKVKVTSEETYYCNAFFMDSQFRAEYKIIQQEVGNFPRDTIRFTAYDHYGRPGFSKYKNVLLFVNEYCGKLYHEKYQYFELYKTVDGKWASPGDPYRFDAHHAKNIVAKRIRFEASVGFDIRNMTPSQIKEHYPQPFYKIEKNRAIPVMGAFVDDLITIKKEGVLKARNSTIDN